MASSSSRPRTSGFHPEDQEFESPTRYQKRPLTSGLFLSTVPPLCGGIPNVNRENYKLSPVSPSPSCAFFSNSILPNRNVIPADT